MERIKSMEVHDLTIFFDILQVKSKVQDWN